MRRLTVIQPYSDDTLTYDESKRQYFLTPEYCKSEFDDTFHDDGVLEKRIKKNTRLIYRYIYSRVNSNNVGVVDRILRATVEGREFIKQLLSIQMEADIENGYNDLNVTPAVNVGNGQVIDRNEIKRNLVTVEVENLVDDSAKYLGINIAYAAPFPPYVIYF